ncbi:MAG: tetratricopeptide repeat protein [Thermodesulfobacteriota bacterium]
MKGLVLLVLGIATPAAAGEAELVFDQVRRSVVTVTALDERGQAEWEGSGVAVAEGQVLTNCHVIDDAQEVRVHLADQDLPARPHLADRPRDLCVLAVPGLAAAPVRTRPFAAVFVGERVYAVGNPLGLGLAVSAGLIAALDQEEPGIYTTAPLSPGSSGGGLFDAQGRLVGITTRVLAFAQNFNLALPADWVAEVASRGVVVTDPPAPPEPDPNWLARAEALRLAAEWPGLVDWAARWRSEYPTSAVAATFQGQALSNLGRPVEAKVALLEAAGLEPRNELVWPYLAIVRRTLGEEEAAQDLGHAMALAPKLGYLWRIQAEWQLQDGDLPASLVSLQESLRREPGDPETWALLGQVQFRLGDQTAAVEAYRAAVRLKPADAVAQSGLAMALAAAGRLDEARSVLAAAAGLPERDARVWLRIGELLEQQSSHGQAEEAFRQALSLDPALVEAAHRLAGSLRKTRRLAEAAAVLRQALGSQSENASLWMDLGRTLLGQGDPVAAMAALEQACALDRSLASAWRLLSEVRFDTGDLSGALAALEQVTRLRPQDAQVWAELGRVQQRMGRPEEAFVAFTEAARLDPENEMALQGLTAHHGSRQEHERSLAYAERSVALSPGSPAAWSNKGYALLKLGRYAEAAEALETAVRLQPDRSNSLINLGEAFLRQGQLGQAITTLEKAIRVAPAAPDARLFAAQAYAASGQLGPAAQHLTALTEITPGFAPGWAMLTLVLLDQNRPQEAKTAYGRLRDLSAALAQETRSRALTQGLPGAAALAE